MKQGGRRCRSEFGHGVRRRAERQRSLAEAKDCPGCRDRPLAVRLGRTFRLPRIDETGLGFPCLGRTHAAFILVIFQWDSVACHRHRLSNENRRIGRGRFHGHFGNPDVEWAEGLD